MDDNETKVSGAEKPVLNTDGTNEIKPEPSNGKEIKSEIKPEPEKPITDFKVAEIWIRSGQIMLDASETFWSDRCRAIGVLEFCKEIVKTAQPPKKPENKIIQAKRSFLNGIRNLKFDRRN